jgi:hypothetical protein
MPFYSINHTLCSSKLNFKLKKGSSLLLAHSACDDKHQSMYRPLRIVYPGAWYHVMNRGRRAENIFLDKLDYKVFVELLCVLILMELFVACAINIT